VDIPPGGSQQGNHSVWVAGGYRPRHNDKGQWPLATQKLWGFQKMANRYLFSIILMKNLCESTKYRNKLPLGEIKRYEESR